ncbi:MAG: phosphoglucosamine mutase [Planctomycetes bacterium]|nr:phosphoglucosamine mutase [Planctomycetota bacterium]MCB9903468.1 phosphoglucosamine mutase [Planctomycetota bacterium]
MSERIFGTDGIRGRSFEGWLTVERVEALGRAVGIVLGRHPEAGTSRRALIGHDGRASGRIFVDALSRGLAAAGMQAVSADLVTTPALAWTTRAGDFVCGAMVSASHNPASDNGIKVFSGSGGKLSDELEAEIEAELLGHPNGVAQGPDALLAPELAEDYVHALLRGAGEGLDLTGMVVALDSAHGGGATIAPRVLRELGATLHSIGDSPDGENINDGVGSTHPEALQAAVLAQGAALGIALDGDGDRCILVDERGEIVHGDGILTLLARRAMELGELPDPRIVATVMSNRGLHRALREVGVSVLTVGVGDRRVVEGLRAERLRLGGEQSGHIVFGADHHFIGDGLYCALRVLRVMRETGRSLSELASPYQPFPQVLLNVRVDRKPVLEEIETVAALLEELGTELGEDGRILLRYSGTEPLARVMVEGPDADRIQTMAQALADLIARELGAADAR